MSLLTVVELFESVRVYNRFAIYSGKCETNKNPSLMVSTGDKHQCSPSPSQKYFINNSKKITDFRISIFFNKQFPEIRIFL